MYFSRRTNRHENAVVYPEEAVKLRDELNRQDYIACILFMLKYFPYKMMLTGRAITQNILTSCLHIYGKFTEFMLVLLSVLPVALLFVMGIFTY